MKYTCIHKDIHISLKKIENKKSKHRHISPVPYCKYADLKVT